jgi:hypothetical protein
LRWWTARAKSSASAKYARAWIAELNEGESLMFQDRLLGEAVAGGAGLGQAAFQQRQRPAGLSVPQEGVRQVAGDLGFCGRITRVAQLASQTQRFFERGQRTRDIAGVQPGEAQVGQRGNLAAAVAGLTRLGQEALGDLLRAALGFPLRGRAAGIGRGYAENDEQAWPELPHFAARRPPGLDPGIVEANRFAPVWKRGLSLSPQRDGPLFQTFGPDQEQVVPPLAALLGGGAIGEHPGAALGSVAEALPELAEDAPDRLSGPDGRGGRGGDARFHGELRVRHSANALPEVEVAVASVGNPQSDAAAVRAGLAGDAFVEGTILPSSQPPRCSGRSHGRSHWAHSSSSDAADDRTECADLALLPHGSQGPLRRGGNRKRENQQAAQCAWPPGTLRGGVVASR